MFTPYLESDIKIIEEVFPKRQIDVVKSITSSEMRKILTDKSYEILHLTIPVDQENWSLTTRRGGYYGC